jgi:hypothetical protein
VQHRVHSDLHCKKSTTVRKLQYSVRGTAQRTKRTTLYKLRYSIHRAYILQKRSSYFEYLFGRDVYLLHLYISSGLKIVVCG